MNFISSFFDSIKDKTTNPFFGTLIFVWLVRNWDLVYTIFNFDSDCNLEDKKEFIRTYYNGKIILEEIGLNILVAFGLMILSYGLIVISRLVVNVTNHNIIPRMNEKTVSKLVVNKARFETVKKTRDEYFIKIQDFEEQVIALEQKNSISKKENIENRRKIKESNDSIEKLNNHINDLETSSLYLKNNLEGKEKALEENEKDLLIKGNVINHYSSVNDGLIEDIESLKDIMINYLNDELDINALITYDELNIPTQIKEAYLNLSRKSGENKDLNLDVMFFGIASHLRYEDVEKSSFDRNLIQSFFLMGLVKIKKDLEGRKNVDYTMAKNLELSVLGGILLDTQNVYKTLKDQGVI